MTPKLDRIVHFDERSRDYPIRTLLTADQPRSYTWGCNAYLDQGSEGACVGFAWAHENAARPVVRPSDTYLAQSVYFAAKRVDQWRGEDYDGTSVLAGAKAMVDRKLLREYRWAFGLQDVLLAVSRKGPAVLGINWYEGMWNTDAAGRLKVSGRIAGGHAILAIGVSVKNQTVTLHNSWGPRWGRGGRALISWDDLDRLLREDGEACIPSLR